MKPWLVLLCLSVVLCSMVLAWPSTPAPTAEDEIVKLERDWLAAEATGDIQTLRRLVADDFIGTAFGPTVLTKTDVVPPEGAAANRLPKSSLRETTVRVFGDTAVLMGYVAFEDSKQPGLRVTSVYQKRAEGWELIAAHMSRAPAGEE